MKVKILFVIDGLEFGGGERVFAQIINGLPQDRFEPFLATASNKAFIKAIKTQYLTTFPMNFSSRYNVASLLRLMRIIKEERIDIVHGQGARAEFYARLAAGFSGRKTYISTVAMPVEGYDIGPLTKFLYRAFDQFSEGYVNRFMVVSDSLVRTMVYGHGVAREKVVKIYNGIETDIYQPADQSANRHRIREEFRVADKEVLIGAIGRLAWQKGFEFFIQAIPDIIQTLPNGRFLLVGDGALRRDLETLVKSLNLQNHLLFAGQRTDVRDILAALDIVVVPSIQEGFPVLTLEAMSMEKAIVATAINGITEQITNAKEGLLVPSRNPAELAQAVLRIACNPVLASALGNAARQKVMAEFSVQEMIQATIKVYDELG